MTDTVIFARDLGKKYVIGHQAKQAVHHPSFREALVRSTRRFWERSLDVLRGRPLVYGDATEEVWALEGVTFEVRSGEAVGIIGRNGAGKSTLFKILSRITEPTRGALAIRGQVASLLEVGTGFHPELTGRENVFLNGAILGMARAEIRQKFDEIVAFANVEKFLDTPVKRYSTGMYLRLAFAVAAHLDPDILVVDEVLAVGDAAFQQKCLGKMGDVSRRGRTVLFVSHNMRAVRRLCSSAIWLDKGRVRMAGRTDAVVDAYLKASVRRHDAGDLADIIATLPPDANFLLREVRVEQEGLSITSALSGKPIDLTIRFSALQHTHGLHVSVEVYDTDGTMLFESINNGDAADMPLVEAGDYEARVRFPEEFFAPRSYYIAIKAAIADLRTIPLDPVRVRIDVAASGRVNRAYPGHLTRGKLAPLLAWTTTAVNPGRRGE